MINDLVGRGSEKASQRGWLFVRTITDKVEGNMGSLHLGKVKSKVCRKSSCLGDHCYHLRDDGGLSQDCWRHK